MPLDIPRIHALCFDVDGTLRDTDDQYVNIFARILRPVRFMLPQRDEHAFARWLVMRIETPANFVYSLPDRVGLDDELVAIGDYLHEKGLLGQRKHTYLLIDGIKEMLEQLAPHYPLAVVSARNKRGTMAFLDHFDLTPYFQHIATAQTTPYTKPRPDPVLWVAEQAGIPPENCLMIGDTTVDIRAGKAAGAQTVGLLCGFGEEPELQQAGADLILPTTADLTTALLA